MAQLWMFMMMMMMMMILEQVVQPIGQHSQRGGRMVGKVDICNVKKYCLSSNHFKLMR
jgi:hypothetical protein